jgi:predicted Rossmann fold flavoprotein
MRKAKAFQIDIKTSTSLEDFELQTTQSSNVHSYIVQTNKGNFTTRKLLLATGSSPKVWKFLASKNIPIIPAVPSLFTFHCTDFEITALAGVSAEVECSLTGDELPSIKTKGPLLITHWGFSGPAILKLSAWAARALANVNYQFEIKVNFLPEINATDQAFEALKQVATAHPKQQIYTRSHFELSKRFWQKLMVMTGVSNEQKWVEASHAQLKRIAEQLTASEFKITGKSTFKEEFVTAGGVDLKAINFKNFQLKDHPHLYIAGECLNIDAVTGGFNFQNAWTGAYLVATDVAKSLTSE